MQIEKIYAILGGSSKLHFTSGNFYENKKTFNEDQFELVSNWIYLAVLSFLKESKTSVSVKSLMKIFSKTKSEIETVLNTLEKLELVTKNSDNYAWCPGPEKTSDQVSSTAIKTYHKNMFDEAKIRIETIAVNERDFSSMVMMIDSKKIDIAKEEIKNFRRKLSSLLEDGTKNQVFALNIQFFPLSQKVAANNDNGVAHD